VQYGAQARHLSDLADPDANHFVLLGGNDGWIGSAQFADQVSLWRERRYVRLPLRAPAIETDFPLVIDLVPGLAAPAAVDDGRAGAPTSPSPAG
jgi:penicillin G amidase